MAWAKRIGVSPIGHYHPPHETQVGELLHSGEGIAQRRSAIPAANFRKRIIVHELVHLKVPNHGRLFKALVKSFLGRGANVSPTTDD
jgi:hypothetical protein